MAFNGVKRPANRSEVSLYSQPGRGGGGFQQTKVCRYFKRGDCSRINCTFLHIVAPTPPTNPRRALAATKATRDHARSFKWKNNESILTQKSKMAASKRIPSQQSIATTNSIVTPGSMSQQSSANEQSVATQKSIGTQQNNAIVKPLENVCNFLATGKCMKGDRCPCLHSWFHGDGFSLLAQLQDHKKTVTGIVLPEGSSKLYSTSKDGTLRELEFGTAILVIVAVYLILVVKQVVYFARVHGFSQVPQMLLRHGTFRQMLSLAYQPMCTCWASACHGGW